MNRLCLLGALCIGAAAASAHAQNPMKALIIDGQNKYAHRWAEMTPMIRRYLEETGLFQVTVATTPPMGEDMRSFTPSFDGVDVVLLNNYDADPWPEATQIAFERFVRDGGGFVSVHSSNNAFTEWKAYQEMIGVGGWGDRTPASGPYVRWRDGQQVVVQEPGNSGHHGPQHEFVVVTRTPDHAVMQDLPDAWLHVKDELYDCLRGPAKNLTVLATAHSAPEQRGTDEHEPMLMAITYGQGRVFHTTLGHSPEAMTCVGFITTLQRGTEWAATGKVTQDVPPDFPTADKTRVRLTPPINMKIINR